MVKTDIASDRLSLTFAALADPTRRRILASLSAGEASVKVLAEPFDMTLPAITKHLKVLERAGLITRRREAQWRPCQLRAQPLKDAEEWIEHYRRFWELSFDRLEAYLKDLRHREVDMKGSRRGAPRTGGRASAEKEKKHEHAE